MLCPGDSLPTGSPVFGSPEEPPTFRPAAFCSFCLQPPLSWGWPLRDGHDFSLPLRFLDHFLLAKLVGRVRSMFRACSVESFGPMFLLAKKMCASRRPSHPSVFFRSSRTPPVLKLVALRFCRSQSSKISLLTLSDHQQEFPQTF